MRVVRALALGIVLLAGPAYAVVLGAGDLTKHCRTTSRRVDATGGESGIDIDDLNRCCGTAAVPLDASPCAVLAVVANHAAAMIRARR